MESTVAEPLGTVIGTVDATVGGGAVIVAGKLVVLLLVVVAEVLDVVEVLGVAKGAIRTTLPEVDSVATIVAWVFDKAPFCPMHIPYALEIFAALPSSSPTPVLEQAPALSSPTIHSTAPSPIV